jgi:hypothetical protein
MNKIDKNLLALAESPASFPDLQPARRLLVLVPSIEADLTTISRRVWELADAIGVQVLFLGLYSDPLREPSLRRELVTMSAMVQDGKVSTNAEVIFGKDWVDVVKMHSQPGDMVVCLAEQRIGLSRKPLSQILQSELQLPVYILFDLYSQNHSRSDWLTQIIAWTGSAAVIFVFFLLQVRIDHLAKDWAHILLLLFTIPAEVLIIWGWNSLFE